MRSIDAQFHVSREEHLQPDLASMELAWQKLEMAIGRMETHQKHHDQLKAELSSIEQNIERINAKVRSSLQTGRAPPSLCRLRTRWRPKSTRCE